VGGAGITGAAGMSAGAAWLPGDAGGSNSKSLPSSVSAAAPAAPAAASTSVTGVWYVGGRPAGMGAGGVRGPEEGDPEEESPPPSVAAAPAPLRRAPPRAFNPLSRATGLGACPLLVIADELRRQGLSVGFSRPRGQRRGILHGGCPVEGSAQGVREVERSALSP